MPRFFTLRQAERLLPEVEPAIRRAIALRAEYQESESRLNTALRRIMMLGGTLVDTNEMGALRSRRDATVVHLKQALEEIVGYGCLVKDLDIGLIDFPSLYRDREVCLCWRLGENGITFWHGVDEGFRGRKAIDAEFLDNHRGGEEH